jgi:hypothetical protein
MPKSPNIHPDAPAGGGGPGFFRSALSLGLNPDSDLFDTPSPLGVEPFGVAVSDGTVPATGAAAIPAPVAATPAAGGEAEKTDPDIETLKLSETAKKAAYALKKAHPSVVFTSGFRTTDDQARAMSGNVVSNRNWIKETYIQSTARDKCQKWVDDNPDQKTKDEIHAGLKSVMDDLSDSDLARLSKHLSGDAFDVQPVTEDAEAIKTTIKGLTGITKFLDSEGGLVRWHAQF